MYPVVFIDAMVVKLRDGLVANRPIFYAIAVTVDGERDYPKFGVTGHRDRSTWLR